MDLKRLGIFVGIAICILGSYFFLTKTSSKAQYIFINETTDRSFDESIRVSILGATKRTGVQNAVVISDNFEESDLEKEAAKLFSELRVGERQNGRGILYLYSPSKKLLKIEVGYALEGALPDITVRGLELAAKTFIYSHRYQDFWAELINTLNIEIYEYEHHIENQNSVKFDFSKFRFLSGGAGIASHEYDSSPEQLMQEFRKTKMSDQYLSSSDLNTSLQTYLQSLREGIGDSRLDILSFESRIFREITPLTSFQLFRNAQMYARAGIDRIFQEKNLAFVFFKPQNPVLPIILKKDDKTWRVQEPLSWSLFHRFEDSMQVYQKFPLSVDSIEFQKYLKSTLGQPLYTLEKPIALSFFEDSYFHDLDFRNFYFHYFWLSKVSEKMNGSSLSAMSLEQLWIVADTYLNLGKISKFLEVYNQVAQRLPQDPVVQANAKFYQRVLKFDDREWMLKR